MTIKELKRIIEKFDDYKDVIVFCEEQGEISDIDFACNNNGHLQLNIKHNKSLPKKGVI